MALFPPFKPKLSFCLQLKLWLQRNLESSKMLLSWPQFPLWIFSSRTQFTCTTCCWLLNWSFVVARSRIINYCKGWTKLGGNDLKLNFIWGSGNVLTNRGSNKIWNKWWSPVKYPCILGISTVSIVHHCFNSTKSEMYGGICCGTWWNILNIQLPFFVQLLTSLWVAELNARN